MKRFLHWDEMRRPVTTLADQGVVSVANFVTVLLYARTLDPGEFGLVALLLTILLAVTAVQTAIVGQVHNLLGARREGEPLASLTGHLLLVQGVFLAAVTLPALAIGSALWTLGGWGAARFTVETAILLAPWLFQDTVRRFLYTKRIMGAVLLNDGVTYGLQIAGAIALAAGLLPRTFDAAQGIYFAGSLAGSVLGAVQLYRIGFRVERSSLRDDLRSAWGIARYLAGGEILAIVGRNATSWMLAGTLGLPALGAYRAVSHFANALNPISIATGLYLPALASSRWSPERADEYRGWFLRLTARLVAGLGLFVLLLGLAAEPLVALAYGPRYNAFPVVLVLEITLAARLLMFLHDTLFHGIVGAGADRSLLVDRVIQLVVLAVAGFPLVTGWGVVGAATWHLLSAVVVSTYAAWSFAKLGRGTRPVTVSDPDVLGFGAEGIVLADPGGLTVRKRFTHPERGPGRARREFGILQRLAAASDRAPVGVRAPRPVAFLAGEHTVVMERCPGTPLDEYLNTRRPKPEAVRRIAERLDAGITHVVETLGEPYHDFCPQNVLWDEGAGSVTVLDLGNDRITTDKGLPDEPFTVSMGCFLGTTVYTAARPGRVGRWGDVHRNAQLFRAIVGSLRARGHRMPTRDLLRMAWSRYLEMGLNGSWTRWAWYLTVGLVVASVAVAWSARPPFSKRVPE